MLQAEKDMFVLLVPSFLAKQHYGKASITSSRINVMYHASSLSHSFVTCDHQNLPRPIMASMTESGRIGSSSSSAVAIFTGLSSWLERDCVPAR